MILLDTCCLLWLASDQARLSDRARNEVSEHRDQLFVSAISAFEIGVKHSKGKLELPLSPVAWFAKAVEFHGLIEMPVSGAIAARSTQLPQLHADPCDRMIIATAQLHGMTILSPDGLIRDYPDTTVIW